MRITLGLEAKKYIFLPTEEKREDLEDVEILEDGCMVFSHPKLEIQYVME